MTTRIDYKSRKPAAAKLERYERTIKEISIDVLFKNPELLDEVPSASDLLGFADEIKHVTEKLELNIKTGKSSVIAYLGPFGSGKSTVMRNIENSSRHASQNHKHIDQVANYA